jgi:hypothetical protein
MLTASADPPFARRARTIDEYLLRAHDDELTNRLTEQDAQRFADLLRRLGGYARADGGARASNRAHRGRRADRGLS